MVGKSHYWKSMMNGYKIFWLDKKGTRGVEVAPYLKEKFDCIEVLDMLIRNSVLLDLLPVNQADLLDNITTNGSPGYSNHNPGDFMILLSTLKSSIRAKTLAFGRDNFSILRDQL
ncbi:hypothetical protein BTVI_60706 [Pitangus sulphuratus]|nr:hypothetical protein BTVI_60706 [Pitangus sulphuratus]